MCMCVHSLSANVKIHFLKIPQVRVQLNVNGSLGCGCDVIYVWLEEPLER